MEKKSSS